MLSKTTILPIVSVICLGITAVTGLDISKDLVDVIATIATIGIGAGVSIWGIIKTHKKKGETNDTL